MFILIENSHYFLSNKIIVFLKPVKQILHSNCKLVFLHYIQCDFNRIFSNKKSLHLLYM